MDVRIREPANGHRPVSIERGACVVDWGSKWVELGGEGGVGVLGQGDREKVGAGRGR